MRAFYKLCGKLAIIMIILGIALTMIGLGNGANVNSLNISPIRYGKDTDMKFNIGEVEADIHSIDIDVEYGEISIKEGELFQILTNENNNYDIKSSEKNGTWRITSKKEGVFNIFGFAIGRNDFFGNHKRDKITIYIPKEYQAKNISIQLGAGKMTAEQLMADRIKLDVGAGKLEADRLYAYEQADMIVGAGQIQIGTIEAKSAEIDCGVGSIVIDGGSLTGKNKIDCGVGDVKIRLTGNPDDYNYYIDSGLGSVIINEEKYSLTSSTNRVNDRASSEFDIECGVGNIQLQIKE